MASHIIVDGYNMIRQSRTLSRIESADLQKGREALVDALFNYKRVKGYRITIVFDGTASGYLSEGSQKNKGIEVIFSRTGETADDVIKRLAERYGQGAIVVTSDNDVAGYAERHGSVVIGSQTFYDKVTSSVHPDMNDKDEYDYRKSDKKGPSRKPPRAKRKAIRKLKKL